MVINSSIELANSEAVDCVVVGKSTTKCYPSLLDFTCGQVSVQAEVCGKNETIRLAHSVDNKFELGQNLTCTYNPKTCELWSHLDDSTLPYYLVVSLIFAILFFLALVYVLWFWFRMVATRSFTFVRTHINSEWELLLHRL